MTLRREQEALRDKPDRFSRTRQANVSQLILCVMAMLCAMAWAAEPARLAVIGSDKSGWSDLLMTRLSGHPSMALVERDDLKEALNEVALQDLLTDRATRGKLGEITGADFLVLLNVMENRARLVVCDTRLGVTLQDLSTGISDQSKNQVIETLANTTMQTIESFAGGIKQVVAVPDFVCRDLTFEHSFLQSDYAELLRSAYRRIPGLAIVAVEEAKAIAAERDLAALDQKKRPASVFIEGEYRTTRAPQNEGGSVEITLRVRDASKVLWERKLPSVDLSQAGRELVAVFSRDLAVLSPPGGAKIDEDGQFRLLIKRAEEFSTLGEFLRSADLREAALLLKPDADEQRIKLVREYTWRNRSPFEAQAWPKGARFDDSNPLWVAAFTRSINDWKRSLQHCGYFILNRRLSREEATDLAHNAIHSITGVRAVSSERLGDCETFKKDFVRHVFTRIVYLDPASQEAIDKLTGALDVYDFPFDNALFRCDGNFSKADDLDLIADLLINRLPDAVGSSYTLNFFLKSSAIRVGSERENSTDFTKAEYQRFLARLVASDRPLVRVYGRYGKLCLRQAMGEKTQLLLDEARAVVNEAKSVGFDLREYDYFMSQLQSEVVNLKSAQMRETNHTVPEPRPEPPMTAPILKSRVSLEPIDLRLVNTEHKGEPLKPGMWWNSSNGYSGVRNFRSLGEGIDAIWDRSEVFFVPRPGEAVLVLADKELNVSDVVSDGRYVWVGACYDWGLCVLGRDGRVLNRIGKEQGLPPCDRFGMVVHPIEPGRVMVAGSFGNENRGWIAMVRFEGDKGRVEVIHEATKIWNHAQQGSQFDTDPAKTFVPQAVFEHVIPGPTPRRIIVILRGYGQPLMVDPESLKVWVYPATNGKWFPRVDPPAGAFLSIAGILWVAGSMDDFCSFHLNEETGLFDAVRERSRWHAGNGTTGSLCRDGDWLHYVGYKWRRINLRTGREELLVDDFQALPHHGSGGAWRIANSAHYGFVAFHDGCLYRVKLTP